MSEGKHIAEQFDIDFEQPLHHVPEHLFNPEKERAERTEYYAMCWVFGWEAKFLWQSLPNYKRREYVLMYHFEEDLQNRSGAPLKRKFAEAQKECEAHYQRNLETAEYMAEVLREDFKLRRPCSYRMLPQYQWLLDWAFDLAQLPKECLAKAKMEEEA